MKTMTISNPNGSTTAILGLSLLVLAVPACVADTGDAVEPSAAAVAVEPSAAAVAVSRAPADNSVPIAARKPLPVRPPVQPGVATGKDLPAKPARSSMSSADLSASGWTVTLSANPLFLWPLRYSTVTATANGDVGPTPYFLVIRNANTVIAYCSSGTTCSIPVTESVESAGFFTAYVEDFNGDPPQASSDPVFVEWHGAGLTLSASQDTVAVGASSTLTATTVYDVGPSPFYIEIFDVTTGTFLAECGSGTSCSVQVSQAAASTHGYKAYLSLLGTSLPLPGLQETTPTTYVTWSSSGWSLSLGRSVFDGSFETVTATASVDVGPTPYYIEIFDEAGYRLGVCGGGATCTVQFPPTGTDRSLVAFISALDTTLLPSSIQASSNTVAVRGVIF